jgi:NADH:ubiquinone oxidoreductase subunit 6 (subunit J)
MKELKVVVYLAAIIVLGICIYSFLGGNKVFEGKFENDYIAWYFLAKGIFCSLALYLWVRVLEVLSQKPEVKKSND